MYIQTSTQEKLNLGIGNYQCNWGIHIAGLYETEAEREEIVMGYLHQGDIDGDLQLYTPVEHSVEDFQHSYSEAYPKCNSHLYNDKHFQVISAEKLYYPDGTFSTEKMDENLDAFYRESQKTGRRNVRATSDMAWALEKIPGTEHLMVYESRLNYFIPGKPWISLCLYNITKFDGATIMNVLRTHPYTLNGGVLTENPYYQDPDIWLAENRASVLKSLTNMHDTHKEHELFLLMLHLSQRKNIYEIKRTLIEALNSLWPAITFWETSENDQPLTGQTEMDVATIEIATTQHFFGWLSYSYNSSEISPEDHSLVRNAANMTAIIMANLFQSQQRQQELQAQERLRYESYFKTALDKVRLYALTYEPEGTILFCNQYFIEKTGWSHAEIIGRNWFELGASEDQEAHIDAAAFKTAIQDHTLPPHYENRIYTKSGETRYVLWNNLMLYDDQQQVHSITTIGADITDQKMAEKQFREELNEKTTLIKEIHHRVKNNLNVVTSLLNLQKNEITDIESAKNAFEESQRRIITMALVHEDLYQSANLSEIDMSSYVHSLVSRQRELFSAQENVSFNLDIQSVSLDITKAVPIGLIINELLSNACTYAFTEKQEAIISISLREMDAGMCTLKFHDNGRGFPDNFDINDQNSLGLTLVNILTQQIDGSLRYFNNEGATFHIEFPNPEESPNTGAYRLAPYSIASEALTDNLATESPSPLQTRG